MYGEHIGDVGIPGHNRVIPDYPNFKAVWSHAVVTLVELVEFVETMQSSMNHLFQQNVCHLHCIRNEVPHNCVPVSFKLSLPAQKCHLQKND